MSQPVGALPAVAFTVSLVVCEIARRFAIWRSLFDHANERSLHTTPTPRLGGLGIVLASLTSAALVWQSLGPAMHRLIVACAVLALLGFRDDIRPISAALRLVLHFGISFAFLSAIGAPPFLLAESASLPLPAGWGTFLLTIWLVAVLNIYNFMDGMDGLAGSQAVAAALALAFSTVGDGSLFALAIGAGALGFLAHNAPPARIFLGDAGSTFLGMAFAGFAVVRMKDGVPLAHSALPLAPFLLDGTFTIFRRLSRHEKIWVAHRTHLYQRAVQTGLPHREVLLAYLLWLAVCALATLLGGGKASELGIGWAAAVLGWIIVWRWVVRREQSSKAPDLS